MRTVQWTWRLIPESPDGNNNTKDDPLAIEGLAINEYVMGAWVLVNDDDRKRLDHVNVEVSWNRAQSLTLYHQFNESPGSAPIEARIVVVVTEGPPRIARHPANGPGIDWGAPENPDKIYPISVGGYALAGQTMRVGIEDPGAGTRRVTLVVNRLEPNAEPQHFVLAHAPTDEGAIVQLPDYQLLSFITGGHHGHVPSVHLRLDVTANTGVTYPPLFSRTFYVHKEGVMLSQIDLTQWPVPHALQLIQIPGPPAGATVEDPFFVYTSNPPPGAQVTITPSTLYGAVTALSATSSQRCWPNLRLFTYWRLPGVRSTHPHD